MYYNIIEAICRSVRLAWHVAYMEVRTGSNILSAELKGLHNVKDVGIEGWIILK
jgi:hypothetical protein